MFQEWKIMVENLYDRKVKIQRTDNGGEYTSKNFEAFLKKEGVIHQVTVPKPPQQNRTAEGMNRTLVELNRSMLHNMTKDLRAEALLTAVYVRNRCPSSVVPSMTPYEALTEEKRDVSHLRPFGCSCFAHFPKDERTKLDPKAKKCVFLAMAAIESKVIVCLMSS